MPFAGGFFFPVADGAETGGLDAVAGQVIVHGLRAAFAQGEVIIIRSAFIGMAFQAGGDFRHFLHQLADFLQGGLAFRGKGALIIGISRG